MYVRSSAVQMENLLNFMSGIETKHENKNYQRFFVVNFNRNDLFSISKDQQMNSAKQYVCTVQF